MNFLTPRYEPSVVLASVAIAFLASYVALDLVERIRTNGLRAARLWWCGGSIAMGTGIWSMHFVGMLAFSLPIDLGYTAGMTLISWLAAVGVSGLALWLASRGEFNLWRVGAGALAMGAGICAMHYTGMAAIDMAPGVVWDRRLVIVSAVIATGASAAALLIFFWLRNSTGRARLMYKLAASVVMGLAISGMHYTGMAAANFVEGAVCLSADQIGGDQLVALVMVASGALLLLTLTTSVLGSRMHDKSLRLAESLHMQAKMAHLAESLKATNAQLQLANEELQKRSFLDPLTQLANRLLFEDRLAHALSRSERHPDLGRCLAVMFIDLDGFKPVNDSLGHAAGDQVLIEVGRRLQGEARDSDTVARLGGDEFVMLLEELLDANDCAALASRLSASLSRPFVVDGREIEISASIGIAVYPEHGERHQLIARADAAMYAAKRTGGNTYALFEPHMNNGAAQQLVLQSDLRHALERGELALHYQPKFDGRGESIRGVEALMRWTHPQHGSVPPSVFIPIAERFGLIKELGDWVIDEACRQMCAWDDAGMRMRVAINLSVHQLRQDGLVDQVKRSLERHGVNASRLLCEITESIAMEDIEATQKAFDGLSRIGVFLSIDDFGTGYSSLSYLRKLPARQLKIDRTFIQDLEASEDARAVVDAVIKLAHALDLSVVAEGVETPGQRDILLGLSCDELQGYLFARPMPAGQLLGWAAGQKTHGPMDFSPSVFFEVSEDEVF